MALVDDHQIVIDGLMSLLKGEQRYQFAPVRVVEIPKPKGGTRPLGIATMKDRVVQKPTRVLVLIH